jgi:hypothetical protein
MFSFFGYETCSLKLREEGRQSVGCCSSIWGQEGDGNRALEKIAY